MQGCKKLLIVGEQGTGKTAIIKAFLEYQQYSQIQQKLGQYQTSNCMASTNADGDTQNNYLNSENNNSMNFNISSPNMIGEGNGLGINQQSSETQIAGQTRTDGSHLTSSQVSTIDPSSRKPDVCSNTQKRHTIQQNKFTSKMSENTDFSLKILTIEGQKVRVQLWDQGANINPTTTFQPLYTRHVSGCIVVANTSNPSSIAKAAQWKEQFDKITKVKDEPSIPCTLFINHDVKVPSFDNLRPDDSEFQQKTPRSRKESETFQEPSFLDASSKIEQNRFMLTPTRQSVCQNSSLKKINSQRIPSDMIHLSNTPVNHNKQLEFEKLAKKEKNCYFGIYHVSITDPMTVYDSFENFISRVLEDENYAQRTYSIASNFFDQYTVKSVRSNTMNSGTEYDEHINWSDDKQVYDYYQQKNNNKQNNRCSDPYGSASQDYSFKLRPLKDRRYDRNMRDGNNSCC